MIIHWPITFSTISLMVCNQCIMQVTIIHIALEKNKNLKHMRRLEMRINHASLHQKQNLFQNRYITEKHTKMNQEPLLWLIVAGDTDLLYNMKMGFQIVKTMQTL